MGCSNTLAWIKDGDNDESSAQTDTVSQQTQNKRTKQNKTKQKIDRDHTKSIIFTAKQKPFPPPAVLTSPCLSPFFFLHHQMLSFNTISHPAVFFWKSERECVCVPCLVPWIVVYSDGAAYGAGGAQHTHLPLGNEMYWIEQHELMQKSWTIMWIVILHPFKQCSFIFMHLWENSKLFNLTW